MKLLDTKFGEKGHIDSPSLRSGSPNALSKASRNLIPLGQGQLRAFKGLFELAGKFGAREMFNFRDGWAGLDDITIGNVTTVGRGSVFSSLFGMCVYAGGGQLIIDGALVPGAIATTLVRILLRWNGSYTAAESGPYVAGMPEPLAPGVVVLQAQSSVVPNVTGSLSFKIAGYRTTTYGRSRASATSVTVTPNNLPLALVIPLPSTGLTHWAIFATELGAGGRGTHKRLTRPNASTNTEFQEKEIQRVITGLATATGTQTVFSPVPVFSPSDVGKRLHSHSPNVVLPYPTTIIGYTGPTQISISNPVGGAGGTFTGELVAFAAGVDRSVLLNYSEADLAAEFAWTDDFVPPPVSHVGELDKVWVYFTGGDAASNVTESAGSIAQFSNKNSVESVNPFWRIFLPGAVVSVLSRGIDAYMFVGLKTMIIAMQYIEAYESTPGTASVILQGEGISNPRNWCLRLRALYLFSAKGNMLRVREGGVVDSTFSRDLTPLFRLWVQEDVVVCSHPDGKSVVVSYFGISVMFNEETESWSSRLYLNDTAPGKMITGVTTADELVVTMDNGTARKVYDFDKGAGSMTVAVTDYHGSEASYPKQLQRVFANLNADTDQQTVYVSVHRNFAPQFFDDVSTAAGGSTVVCPSANFDDNYVGYFVLIRAAGFGGRHLFGRIKQVLSPTTFKLGTANGDFAASVEASASQTTTGNYMLLAYRMFSKTIPRKGVNEIVNQQFVLPNCYSLAVGVVQNSDGSGGMPLDATLEGVEDGNFGGQCLP